MKHYPDEKGILEETMAQIDRIATQFDRYNKVAALRWAAGFNPSDEGIVVEGIEEVPWEPTFGRRTYRWTSYRGLVAGRLVRVGVHGEPPNLFVSTGCQWKKLEAGLLGPVDRPELRGPQYAAPEVKDLLPGKKEIIFRRTRPAAESAE